MGIQRFRKLTIWQRSMLFIKQVYIVTKEYPPYERYGLVDQIRRATTAIALNIAEGSGSGSDKEFARFLRIALRSVYETITGLEIGIMLKYGIKADQEKLISEADEIVAMIYPSQLILLRV